MNAGETCVYNGSEVCLHPMPFINVSQTSGPGSYSHCCGNAVDYAAPKDTIAYAPFSGSIVAVDSARNGINFVSDNPVWTLQGLTYVTARFLHSDYAIYNVGDHYNQGDSLYWIGDTGPGVDPGAYHLHLDQSPTANDILWYYFDCPGGWGQCWALKDSAPAEEIFYLSGSEQIINTMGLNFQAWTGSPIIIGSKFKWWLYANRQGGIND